MKSKQPETLLSIQEAILGLKRPIKLYCILAVAMNVIILIGGMYVQFKNSQPAKYSSLETCLYGMREIINNNPSESLVNESVIKELKKTTFNVDKIHLIKLLTNYSCDVFLKDSKGVRRYLVTLERNSKFDHMYKIFDVKGMKLDSRYQL